MQSISEFSEWETKLGTVGYKITVDHKQYQKPDFNDALATMLGGIVGFICGI